MLDSSVTARKLTGKPLFFLENTKGPALKNTNGRIQKHDSLHSKARIALTAAVKTTKPRAKDRSGGNILGDDLIRAKHPQGDLFLFDVVSAPIKDLIDTLEHPFYSLGKKPEMQSRHYRNGDVQLELAPSRKGLPTIYDKDLLIYAVSKVAAAMRRGEKPGRMVEMPTSEILQFTNRGTSGRDYRALEDALERLAGTLIKTTIRGKGRTDTVMFHLLEIATLSRRGRLGLTGCTIQLSEWIYEAIECNSILTLHPDYFRLRRPLEKRIYEIARKHCGRQREWAVGLDKLHLKSGARGEVRNFKVAVKGLAASDHLPDYHVRLEPGGDLVVFERREGEAAEVVELPQLDPDAMDVVRRMLPGRDVYALESEWRQWAGAQIAAGKMHRPDDADLAFIGFAKGKAPKG